MHDGKLHGVQSTWNHWNKHTLQVMLKIAKNPFQLIKKLLRNESIIIITESKLSVQWSGHISSHQHCAHYPRWQHHFTVPKTILDDLWPHFLGGADRVYFQYSNALSTVSFGNFTPKKASVIFKRKYLHSWGAIVNNMQNVHQTICVLFCKWVNTLSELCQPK